MELATRSNTKWGAVSIARLSVSVCHTYFEVHPGSKFDLL